MNRTLIAVGIVLIVIGLFVLGASACRGRQTRALATCR
jgi:hypothetical protein